MAKTTRREPKTDSVREQIFERHRKEIFNRRIGIISSWLGFRKISILPLRKESTPVYRSSSARTINQTESV